jgi:hypothetical protein
MYTRFHHTGFSPASACTAHQYSASFLGVIIRHLCLRLLPSLQHIHGSPFRLFGTASVGSQSLTGIARPHRLQNDPKLAGVRECLFSRRCWSNFTMSSLQASDSFEMLRDTTPVASHFLKSSIPGASRGMKYTKQKPVPVEANWFSCGWIGIGWRIGAVSLHHGLISKTAQSDDGGWVRSRRFFDGPP